MFGLCSKFEFHSNEDLKLNLTNATLSTDGLYLIAIFDNPVYRTDFTDCSTVFSQDTLNWLPAGRNM